MSWATRSTRPQTGSEASRSPRSTRPANGWWGASRLHDATLEVIDAWPAPADLKQAGITSVDARLNEHTRRQSTSPGLPRSSRP